MPSGISLATVVTTSTFKEYLILRYSFAKFHPEPYRWFVRCDRATESLIRTHSDTTAVSFCELWDKPVLSQSRKVLREKMNAIADAWASEDQNVVAFLNSDLIFTAPCLPGMLDHKTELVLSPNHFPWKIRELSPYYGYFNSGFVLTRSPRFHESWRSAYQSAPWKYSDQACLNEVAADFSVTLLGQEANVGSWRSERADSFSFKPISTESSFLRVPCFGTLATGDDWRNKMFALHCLRFLKSSVAEQHNMIFREIIQHDESGWYQASLRLLN
ncbi:hypothetical protein [Terracidiphilus sp.]|jgi:hypothetical protein|uniref:hypothetical protein n=1 Tax=Terracidiphilus sp. TaxID=1964191 RepID=UPI003C1A9681